MRVLVTGANGFVGNGIIRHLREIAGLELAAAARRPATVFGTGTVLVGDLGPKTDWAAALQGIDAVVHCAGLTHQPNGRVADLLNEFRNVNVAGTRRLAEVALAAGVKRFIYISSVKVHGEATHERPFSEADAVAPSDFYAISKYEAESALTELTNRTGFETVILRPPVIYGPSPNPKSNMLRLTQWIAKGVPLPLRLVRNQRSMLSIANLASAVKLCLIHPGAAGQTYLVSDEHDLSVPQLIQIIAQALGRSARLWPMPVAVLRLGGKLIGQDVGRLIDSLQVDSRLIGRQLGWRPMQSTREGIDAMVARIV